jgi:hypothetical protein
MVLKPSNEVIHASNSTTLLSVLDIVVSGTAKIEGFGRSDVGLCRVLLVSPGHQILRRQSFHITVLVGLLAPTIFQMFEISENKYYTYIN